MGRSPGSQVLVTRPAFPVWDTSGTRGARRAVYSCGGSSGMTRFPFHPVGAVASWNLCC